MIRIAIIGLGRVFFCYEEFFKKNKSKKYLVKVVCDSYSISYTNDEVYSLSSKFRRVYEA